LKIFDPNLPETSDRLFSLGKLLAADIFLNNSDRIPTHTFKQGNAGNVIFEVKIDESTDEQTMKNPEDSSMSFLDLVACDNKCYPITSV
jgi:hypothetical protein